jgi:two-component system response regulator FlrC
MILAAQSPAAPSSPAPVAESAAMREVLLAADDVAPTPTTVLLLGESGTGKELLARHLHARSGRRGPWVAVNCAALPAELLESELFGHEKGAFTGASERRQGRFEQADGGTLLLDEVSELPLGLQAKLLRVLQEREVDRVGGRQPVRVDVRIVATSNRDLAEMVRAGAFRSDLYYRLHVFPIVLPPLRERPEDVAPLAERLLAEAARDLGRPAPALAAEAVELLRRHPFPGNVRELRNLLERALVRCRGPALEPRHLAVGPPCGLTVGPRSGATAGLHGVDVDPQRHPAALAFASATGAGVSGRAPAAIAAVPPSFPAHLPLDLAALERLAIAEALQRVNGNRTHAARLLGIGLRTLRNKLKVYREEGAPLTPDDTADDADRPDRPGEAPAHPRISAEVDARLAARRSHGEAA